MLLQAAVLADSPFLMGYLLLWGEKKRNGRKIKEVQIKRGSSKKDEENGDRSIWALAAPSLKVIHWAACGQKVLWLIARENCCEAQYSSTQELNKLVNQTCLKIEAKGGIILPAYCQVITRGESVLSFGGWIYACLIFGPLRNMLICVPGDRGSLAHIGSHRMEGEKLLSLYFMAGVGHFKASPAGVSRSGYPWHTFLKLQYIANNIGML